MKKILLRILITLVILVLLGWLLYPTVADQLARKEKLERTEKYLQTVHAMSSDEITKMLEDADTANGITEEMKKAREARLAAEAAEKAAEAAAKEAENTEPSGSLTEVPETTSAPEETAEETIKPAEAEAEPAKEKVYQVNSETGEVELVEVEPEATEPPPTKEPEPAETETPAAIDNEVKATETPASEDSGTTEPAKTDTADAAAAEEEEENLIRPGDVFTAHAERSSTMYRNLLDFGDGMIGVLEIPSIHVSLPIEHISADTRPDHALVHVEGSSLPGETGSTHTVLAGPRKQKAPGILGDLALTGDRMLEDLDQVTPGNRMMILLANRTLLYEVRGVQTLSPDGLKDWTASRDPDEDRLTLITERDGRRLLVEAVRIPIESATEALKAGDGAKLPADWITILALGCPVMLLALLVMAVIERIKRRAYRLPTEGKAREVHYNEALLDETENRTAEQPEKKTDDGKDEANNGNENGK